MKTEVLKGMEAYLNSLQTTKYCDLAQDGSEKIIRDIWNQMEHYAVPVDQVSLREQIIYLCKDYLTEIGIAKAERAAMMKDCDMPDWWYEEQSKTYEERAEDYADSFFETEIPASVPPVILIIEDDDLPF